MYPKIVLLLTLIFLIIPAHLHSQSAPGKPIQLIVVGGVFAPNNDEIQI